MPFLAFQAYLGLCQGLAGQQRLLIAVGQLRQQSVCLGTYVGDNVIPAAAISLHLQRLRQGVQLRRHRRRLTCSTAWIAHGNRFQ
jgi:hypothetical protein